MPTEILCEIHGQHRYDPVRNNVVAIRDRDMVLTKLEDLIERISFNSTDHLSVLGAKAER